MSSEEQKSLESKGTSHIIREYLASEERKIQLKKALVSEDRRGDMLREILRDRLTKKPKGKYHLDGHTGWRVSADGRGIERIEIDPESLAEIHQETGAVE